MFLRIFDLQDARSCLRWEHTARSAGTCYDPPRQSLAPARAMRAKKQCARFPTPAPAAAHAEAQPAAEAVDDFVHVDPAHDEEVHDFELV